MTENTDKTTFPLKRKGDNTKTEIIENDKFDCSEEYLTFYKQTLLYVKFVT